MVNINCLEGIRCPDCGNERHFYIESTSVMYVTDDGAECRSDIEWDEDGHTQCPECERSGKLMDFKITPPKFYIVASSHGVMTIDADGFIVSRKLDNHEVDGGGHLARIARFDLAEWRNHWGKPESDRIDILDLAYWYVNPATGVTLYADADETWRTTIATDLHKRRTSAVEEGVV